MKIISWNVNGIRAVHRKESLQEFIATHDPDIVCFQETKAKIIQLEPFHDAYPAYEQYYHEAEKPGYSGTGIWVRRSLALDTQFTTSIPSFPHNEGRVCSIEWNNHILVNCYFPNGQKSTFAWEEKLVFYQHFLDWMNQMRDAGKTVIWTGDVNCAHQEIDLARPESNKKSIGFLPEERAWVSQCVQSGWSDVFRTLYPEQIMYSWWSVYTRARERNVGWRIDYFFVDQANMNNVTECTYLNDQMGSDHCPILLDINL